MQRDPIPDMIARTERETLPYQINSPSELLLACLPEWLRATDNPADGTVRLPKSAALALRHIQPNRKNVISVMPLDNDRPDAAFAWDDGNVAAPSVIIGNPDNGHAHTAHILAAPVTMYEASRPAPLKKLAAIERGMIRRTGADPSYSGNLIKNPFHPDWRVMWWARAPYALADLEHWLEPDDMKPVFKPRHEIGLGRNCTVFEDLRHIAYSEVRRFKCASGQLTDFRQRLEEIAHGLNLAFDVPLAYREVRDIARSVSKWTWRHFTLERFSEIQRQRVERRWADHEAAERTRPWEEMGVSRATYYRRKSESARH